VANVGETALGTFNTFGGSLSEDDKVKLLKTRYSSLQKELEELHGSSMRNTGKHDDQGKPRKQLDKEVAKAKHTALADRLIMDLAPLSPELREAALDAIAPPETIRKAVQKAFLPK
jgi:predicted nuclease with TOPRIM domain